MKIPALKLAQFQGRLPANEIYVNSFSDHIRRNQKLIDIPHSHDFYLCVLFINGTGFHEIDFSTYEIGPGKVFFLKPGQSHFWKFTAPPEGYIFFHSQSFYELNTGHALSTFPFYSSLQNPPVLEIDTRELRTLVGLFKEALSEYGQSLPYRAMKLGNLINAIYIELTRGYTAQASIHPRVSTKYVALLEQLESLINAHFYKEKFPKYYAQQLGITTKHLNRVVRDTINKTTKQLISERVILEAMRLIVQTADPLSEIAYTLEFSDYAYFSRNFHLKTGMTPMDFRNAYHKT